MKLFKNYKKLYLIEKNNNKILTEKNLSLKDDKNDLLIKLQDQTNDIRNQKEEITKLKIQIEDLQAFLEQKIELVNALKKEKSNLKRKITNMKKEMGVENGN